MHRVPLLALKWLTCWAPVKSSIIEGAYRWIKIVTKLVSVWAKYKLSRFVTLNERAVRWRTPWTWNEQKVATSMGYKYILSEFYIALHSNILQNESLLLVLFDVCWLRDCRYDQRKRKKTGIYQKFQDEHIQCIMWCGQINTHAHSNQSWLYQTRNPILISSRLLHPSCETHSGDGATKQPYWQINSLFRAAWCVHWLKYSCCCACPGAHSNWAQ